MTTAVQDKPMTEQLLREYVDSFPLFAQDLVKIQTKKGDLIPLKLNEDQEILEAIEKDILARGRMLRQVILKSRRRGVSTHRIAKNYHRTSLNFNRYAYHVTHDPDSKDFLFGMTKRMHANNPCKPQELYNSKSILEFNTKDRKGGLDSAIRVGAAGKDHLGSGQLIHYLHLCMHPDTPVLTQHGRQKRIAEVEVGDIVCTHSGELASVTAKTKKSWEEMPAGKTAVVITPWMGSAITLSPQHKVWTQCGWVEAQDLDADIHMLSMPIRQITHSISSLPVDNANRARKQGGGAKRIGPDSFPLTEETGYFIGYYLAEGCLSGRTPNGMSKITLAFHPSEKGWAERARNAVSAWCKDDHEVRQPNPSSLTHTLDIYSVSLASLVDTYFGARDHKHVPDWVFQAGSGFCRGLVHGYLHGDGSKTLATRQNYTSHSISASSIRESLTYQVRDLLASLGYGWASVRETSERMRYGRSCKRQWTMIINGLGARKLREDLGFAVGPVGKRHDRAVKHIIDEASKCVWLRIKNIDTVECDEFIDLAIGHKDHSFRTPHFSVSNSELAKWPRHTEKSLLTSLLQCVPRDPDSEVFVESTAAGLGGEFYEWFWSARYFYEVYLRKGKPAFRVSIRPEVAIDNEYAAIFIPWFCNSENKMEPEAGFTRTADEQALVNLYGINDTHLKWRRVVIANECKGSVEIFQQEYPGNPEEAFLASGRPVFTPIQGILVRKKAIEKQQENNDTRKFYSCQMSTGQWVAETVVKNSDTNSLLQVWEEPRAGVAYVLAADVAEGLETGDWDSVDVVEQLTGRQVAHWHGHIAPDQLGVLLYHLGKRYNVACVAPERNNHGLTTVTKLFDLNYPNLFVENVPEPPNKIRKRYGWHTGTSKTGGKAVIIDNLAADFRISPNNINCVETLGEMLSYKHQADGSMAAETGRFDDRVMSLAIANHVRKLQPLPSAGSSQPQGPGMPGTPVKAPSMGAYT